MNIQAFKFQMAQCERRYQDHSPQREARKQARADGRWEAVDSPERIANRLHSLGLDALLTEALASVHEPARARSAGGPAAARVGRGPQAAFNPLERIIAANDLLPVAFLYEGARVAASTGRVVIRESPGILAGYGTGFLVSPRLLLTNNHVLKNDSIAGRSSVQFRFFEDFAGTAVPTLEFRLVPGPEGFFETDAALDFSLVAVAPVSASGFALETLGWNPLIEKSGKSIVGEKVNIVQHPGGRPQQVALRSNEIIDVLDNFLHYTSDTEQGSSGSGAYNDQWELAALHHSGVPRRNSAGQILLIDDTVWNGADDTAGRIAWIANEGVRISQIVRHLRAKQSSWNTAKRALFEAAFESRPPLARFLESAPASAAVHAPMATGAPSMQGTTAIWQIPLTVRVDLGGLPASQAVHTTPGSPATNLPIETPDVRVDPDTDSEFRQLRENAESFADRVYYDLDADTAAAAEYYAEIGWDEEPALLYQQLHELLSHGTTDFSYSAARLQYLYPWVDVREDAEGARTLASIYSGAAVDILEAIRTDLETARVQTEQLQRFTASEAFTGEESLEFFLESLEASMPFNCEHVVPQSWFNKKRPMVSDLHHLFACESDCNSFRGNIPYFDFDETEEAVRTACGRREGQDKFEPEAGKGAVARATLYFLIRFPGIVGDRDTELQPSRIATLVRWHKAEPPGVYERHRNAAIFEFQGNRNPLIDHPEKFEDFAFFRPGFG